MWSIDELQATWQLATSLHDGQKYGGQQENVQVEYINHIGSVVFEILAAINVEKDMNADLAIKCAMLHDTIEDTEMSYEKIKIAFDESVADGVLALTKNDDIEDKSLSMADSLRRIKQQPKEIWAVKMADRISNLQAPPYYWTNDKKQRYLKEARQIHQALNQGNHYLAGRLAAKIDAYQQFIS